MSPGNSPSAITVGAIDDRSKTRNSYQIASFSSRGPTKEGLRKPDIVAPGVKIKSLLNNTDGFKTLNGTSMATPFISGSLSLLLSKNSSLGPRELKTELMRSCRRINENLDSQGAGMIDLSKLFYRPKPNPRPSFFRPNIFKVGHKFKENKPLPISSNEVKTEGYTPDILVIILFLILVLIRI